MKILELTNKNKQKKQTMSNINDWYDSQQKKIVIVQLYKIDV